MSLEVKCAKKGCTCGGPLYMHGGCHMNSPTHVTLFGDKLNFRCGTCDRHIVTFIVSDVEGSLEQKVDPVCHPKAGTWGILHDNVDLVIQCAECKVPFLKCKVLGIAPLGVA